MQIKISARHGHLGEATQQFIHEKAEKLLRYFDRLTSIEVTVDMKEDAKVVKILAHAEHKHEFVAHETNADIGAAVDLAVAKIEGEIRRYKDKLQDHRRRPAMGDVAVSPEPSDEE